MGTLQSARRIIGNLFGDGSQPQAQPLAPPSSLAQDSQQPITIQVPMSADQAERVEQMRLINEYNEDRESADQRFWRRVANFCCRTFPWIVAFSVAYDAGKYFTQQPFGLDPEIASTYLIAFVIECTLPIVVIAWSNTIITINKTQTPTKDMLNRRTLQMLGWALMTLVSGSALYMFLADKTAFAWNPQHVAVLLRVIGTMSVDPILVFCVHYTTKSLAKFIEQEKQKTQGITDLTDMIIEREEKMFLADSRRRDNLQFLKQKEEWSALGSDLMRSAGDAVRSIGQQAVQNMQLPQAGGSDASSRDNQTPPQVP